MTIRRSATNRPTRARSRRRESRRSCSVRPPPAPSARPPARPWSCRRTACARARPAAAPHRAPRGTGRVMPTDAVGCAPAASGPPLANRPCTRNRVGPIASSREPEAGRRPLQSRPTNGTWRVGRVLPKGVLQHFAYQRNRPFGRRRTTARCSRPVVRSTAAGRGLVDVRSAVGIEQGAGFVEEVGVRLAVVAVAREAPALGGGDAPDDGGERATAAREGKIGHGSPYRGRHPMRWGTASRLRASATKGAARRPATLSA